MATELTPDALAALRTTHAQDRMAPVLTRAITKNGIEAASFDNQAASRLARTFSVELPTGKVSNQKHSGRCWEFSLLNTLRHKFATRYHVKDFELSQNYLFFWDKIERANIFIGMLNKRRVSRLMTGLFSSYLLIRAKMVVSGRWRPAWFKSMASFQLV